MQIPIDSITVPERVRKDPGNLESLMASLKRVGLLIKSSRDQRKP